MYLKIPEMLSWVQYRVVLSFYSVCRECIYLIIATKTNKKLFSFFWRWPKFQLQKKKLKIKKLCINIIFLSDFSFEFSLIHKNTSNFIPSNIQWTLFYNLLIYTPILNIRVTKRKSEERRLRHLSLTSYHTSSPPPSSFLLHLQPRSLWGLILCLY